MGLEISDILRADYFKDFRVLAGHKGLNKQIQGIAILDAPDGYKWTKGRELVVSSGYIFQANPNLFEEYLKDKSFKEISGMAIKVDRYLKKIDQKILDKFDEYEIPLIYVPNEPSWMDIMNHLNVLVMNDKIKQFKIEGISKKTMSDISYQNRKINKILNQIEKEMNFPAMVYDVQKDKPYYSSSKFEKISAELNLSDFWDPSFKHTTEILCDNLGITRFRFIDKKYKAPFSWIRIPIVVDKKVKAYFVVLEAEGLIDYFDQFALRIGFLLIQSLYEQILVSQSIRDWGFKKFIREIVNEILIDKDFIIERARELNLNTEIDYLVLATKYGQDEKLIDEEVFESKFQSSFGRFESRMATTGENLYLFLIPMDQSLSTKDNIKKIKKTIDTFKTSLKKDLPEVGLKFGISDIKAPLGELYKSYTRALKALELGNLLYGNLDYFTYSELGPLAWIDVKHDEIDIMKNSIKGLLEKDKNKELIGTLTTYLESNMNYSLTAKKLYIHINTVRKRMEEVKDLIDIDLDDPISRFKLELLLKII